MPAFLTAMVLGISLLAGCGSSESTQSTAAANAINTQETTVAEAQTETADSSAADSGENAGTAAPAEFANDELHHIEIDVQDYGTIYLELDATAAPITVENFLNLAQSGFYDGLTFHRIMDGFMIQGGKPAGTGGSGSNTNIKGEFAANGVENPISHKEGVISMARSRDPDSASSQFFIMVDDGEYLDGNYAAFGWVTEGQEIVDKIAADAEPVDNNGTIPADEQPVITQIRVID